MAFKKAWWVRIAGGREAISRMASFGTSQKLRQAELMRRAMPSLRNDPVGTAAMQAGVDPATARRLDIAGSADRAAKRDAILGDAGIAQSMRDPYDSRALAASKRAEFDKRIADARAKREADAGFWGKLDAFASHEDRLRVIDAKATGDPEVLRYARGEAGYAQEGEEVFGQGIMNVASDVSKNVVDALGTTLSAISSPIAAPHAAGKASWQDNDLMATQAALSASGITGELAAGIAGAFSNFAKGIESVVDGKGVSDQQKRDMRNAGYDPDSWTDRYGWYADIHGENGIVSDRWANALISEGKNPHKVNLVREIITTGVDEDPSRWKGLSPDGQKMLASIQAGEDDEGAEIFKRLVANATSLGSNLAEAAGYTPEDGRYTAVAMVGDLAAYWFLDPLVVGGKALNAYRNARFGVDFDPQEVKEAIAKGGTTLAKRWDDILERVDTIYLLENSKNLADRAQAAKEYTNFQRVHKDVEPFFGTLIQMRKGSLTGAMFKADGVAPGAKFRDSTDFEANVIGLELVDDPAKFKPIFSLRTKPGEKLTQEVRDEARAAIADRIGDAIFAHSMLAGRPLVGEKLMMPGQHRFATPIRAGIQRTMDAILGQNGKLLDQLTEAKGKGLVDFSKEGSAATAHVIDSAKGGEWLHQNYTRGGVRDRLAMTIGKFALTKDAPVIRFDDAANTRDIYNFAKSFMPRGQASYMAVQWAQASPATRSVMMGNLMDSLGNARLATDGRASTDFWRQQLKGRENVRKPGEPRREAYSTPATDEIQTEAGAVAAAMYSTQFADGVRLPSYVDILKNTEKVGVFSALAGISHSRWVNAFTRAAKVGQVGTTSNMLRQGFVEARALQALDDPFGAVRAYKTRMGLAGQTAAERAAANEVIRQAKAIQKSGKLDVLTPLHGRRAWDEYADGAGAALKAAGKDIHPQLAQLLRQGAEISDIARGRSALRLALTRTSVDPLRKLRAKVYAGLKPEGEFTYKFLDEVDDRMAQRIEDGARAILGGNTAHYMDGGLVDDLDQMQEGLEAGQRLAALKLRNTQGYLGAAGDVGAQRWGNALGLRMADPVGKQVIQAVAAAALREGKVQARLRMGAAKGTLTPEQADKIRAALGKADDPAELAGKLISEDEKYRLHGRRGQYIDGKYVGNTPDQELALKAWGEQMVEDVRHYLGLTTDGALTGAKDPAHARLLVRIAKGQDISADDLAKVSEDLRPPEVHAPVIVGKTMTEASGGTMTDKIGDKASKLYSFVVARPLQRMVHDPQVIAAHHEAMVKMEPLARALNKRGMSAKAIYDTLDTLAYGHGVARVARYSDNPHVMSYFAALSNNFLWYERAMEDFARRAIQITKADPAILARAHLMFESAGHAGLVQKSVGVDEEGNAKTDYVFTWPGSGLALRAVNDSARALGFADDNVVQVPVWQNLTSPVRYLSPSLQNPLGFTTTPLIGMPLRVAREAFPEATLEIDSVLTTLEGGERSFGSQDLWESLTPVYIKRIINGLSREERDSQFASAMKNVMIYMQAAGRLPEPDAPEIDHQRARDELKQMVANVVILRNLFGAFLPATPGTMNSNPMGVGDDDLNIFDRERGVTTIRGEWFTLLEDMNQRYPQDSSRAFSEAAAEWMRRDLGSIVDKTAFTVGTSQPAGVDDAAGFASGLDVTQWMLDNKTFLESYGQAAFKLLPPGGSTYYSKIGHEVQLRTELRQHKDLGVFYEDLVIKQTDSAFYAALAEKSLRLESARTKPERDAVWAWFNETSEALRRANPIWAKQQNDNKSVDYIASRVAPAVQRMAEDPNLPAELAGHRQSLQVMSALYSEYRERLAEMPGTGFQAVNSRRQLTKAYGAKGDELFEGSPVGELWKTMRAWED